MAFSGKIIGGNKLKAKFAKIKTVAPSATKKAMTKILVDMDRDVKSTIQKGSRSGRIYGKHRVSAPGEAPKIDTGVLASSFSFRSKGDKRQIVGTIENSAKHAKYLEFKPKSQGGRPFMRPLYNRWRERASKRLMITIKTTIRKVARG